MQAIPDDDLALMLPGEVFAAISTGVLRFRCFGHSLSQHPQLAEARAHWLALVERGNAQP